MHSVVTQLRPEQPGGKLRRVEWFAALTDLSKHQAYEVIASGQLPPECIVRLGRRIRLVEDAVMSWMTSAQSGEQRKEA